MLRKRYGLILLVLLLAAAGIFYENRISGTRVMLGIEETGLPYLTVYSGEGGNRITLWQDKENGKGYFFLPAYAQTQEIRLELPQSSHLWMDGKRLEDRERFIWQEEAEYLLETESPAGERTAYEIAFIRSANVPAAFVCTESGQMTYLLEDKQNEEKGELCIVKADGETDYHGELKRISGRGNSTWMRSDKKPYALKLPAAASLCGLKKGEKWSLLSLYREGSKLNNKLAMDMAEELGLLYTPQGTWVDLYLNGEYAGIYLLTEAVTVGEGRVEITDLEEDNLQHNQKIAEDDRYEEERRKGYEIASGENISGGYLIEKDAEAYYQEEVCGVTTSAGNRFSVKAPKHLSREQADYLGDYLEEIERRIAEKDASVWEYLDKESFAKRMLLDEISMDYDACVTSMFFYKEQNDKLLYSGPIWDYDIAFGGVNADDAEGKYVDYESTILSDDGKKDKLSWYSQLMEDEELQETLRKEYEKLLSFWKEELEERLNTYGEYLSASAAMDAVRWRAAQGAAGWYADYDANVSYLRFFVAKRLNVIGQRLLETVELLELPASGQTHTVTFLQDEEVVETLTVEDGAQLTKEQLPAYDTGKYAGWRYQWGGERFRETIPVYDDMILYNEGLQEDS